MEEDRSPRVERGATSGLPPDGVGLWREWKWELNINRRWQKDPSFYTDQAMTALLEDLTASHLHWMPGAARVLVTHMEEIPKNS